MKSVAGVARSLRREHFYKVADLPFFAHVGNDAAVGVGIKTRHVAGIGIAVGVPIGDFKQQKEVVAIRQDLIAHRFSLSSRFGLLGFGFWIRVVVLPVRLARDSISSHLLVEAQGETALGQEI